MSKPAAYCEHDNSNIKVIKINDPYTCGVCNKPFALDTSSEAITLRDQFAIAALNATRTLYGTWAMQSEFSLYAAEMVKHAYVIADAMLGARKKQKE